jgi:tRNA (cytidine/uridine-2'-O-)-methyltransferase
MIHLALYQPEIPQNVGTLIRLSSCLDVVLHVIEPCRFVFGDRRIRRSGMDYINMVDLRRHQDWETFHHWQQSSGQRLICTTTTSTVCYTDFRFNKDDIILMGPESIGLPENLVAQCDAELTIPMTPGRRSINVAICAGMLLGESIRQNNLWPES